MILIYMVTKSRPQLLLVSQAFEGVEQTLLCLYTGCVRQTMNIFTHT